MDVSGVVGKLGFVFVVLGGVIMALSVSETVNFEGGALIMIGPIPIVGGTSSEIVLVLAILTMFILLWFVWRKLI
ncbi:TIGR00304 family membrane protein [Methanonatronarchaeum thermophilum]|uniref:TIGR00304 family membrane protein n=1 Tax=Methanonatronarchaeum thermophilum TaxID=1927129 RepID=UPI00191B9066|nr:DUF131 domain-containing protein [Methanonatronarchaeum thermophilum]